MNPQALGVLPFPTGLLVLPECVDPAAPEALARLRLGATDGPLPTEWEFYRLAANGDLAAALGELLKLDAKSPANPDRVRAYNRFVLAPEASALPALREALDGELALLLSVAAYVSGVSDEAPAPSSDAQGSPAVFSLACLARAAAEIERGDSEQALAAIDQGLTAIDASDESSPLLAAQLFGQRAALLRERDPAAARASYRAALDLARQGVSAALVIELAVGLGTLEQEIAADSPGGGRAELLAAIDTYQEAVRAGLSAESDPDTFALVQNNLGLAYLALPMREAKDALRMAVAVQSFREALTIYARDTHPEAWASTQANLANALQYLPSSHPAENLAQAVEIYEELLEVRPSALDPLGHARLLANQANALAHLGAFAPARAKLSEAHKLFHWHGAPELAAAVLEQVARIDERIPATAGT